MGNQESSGQFSDGHPSAFNENIGAVLFEKVQTFCEENADKITGMLLEMPVKELEIALKDDIVLKRRIDEAAEMLFMESNEVGLSDLERKEALGNMIYPDVKALFPEENVAEKITGMLLEMKINEIANLVQNKKALLDKIYEAEKVLVNENRSGENERDNCEPCSPTRTELGEVLYKTISAWYPDEEQAAKLTGMLLEMEKDEILKVAQDEEQLKYRVQEAEHALKKIERW